MVELRADEAGQSMLQGDEGVALLDAVDQLRDLGSITHELSLPQIVVVGDQSCGKSSVLEAISGLSFPTNEGLCTQFATEVILRRSRITTTSVSIKSTNTSRKDQLKEFAQRWRNASLEQLAEIVEEAKSIMGLSNENKFSEDVLKLEISGPAQDHLTLVDLPGLFQNVEKDQSPKDRDLVRKLITTYVTQPRAIVLAILSGSHDHQLQGILELLKGVDKAGERTLGVVTMPDMLTEGSPRFLSFKALIDNRQWPLRLGWHVLRNPNFSERKDPSCDRKRIEDTFFEKASWSSVPESNRGALTLRRRLSQLLRNHISKELPEILEDINAAIKRCESEKEKLGEERDTPEKQRLYLLDIGEKFKHLMRCALDGEYSDDYFDSESHRLRALIRNANEDYAETMLRFGHSWQELPRQPGVGTTHASLFDVAPKPFGFKAARPQDISHERLVERVVIMQRSHRGLELPGLPQPRMVGKLFKQQSEKWRTITDTHVDHILDLTKQFVEDLLISIAGGKTSAALLRETVDPEFEKREGVLKDKIDEIMRPYTNGRTLTLNRKIHVAAKQHGETASGSASLGQFSQNDISSCETILQSVQTYYDIALNVLLDNVAVLVVEHCLLDGLSEMVSPKSVQTQSLEKLERIAGESPDIVSRRRVLSQMLEDYRRGQNLLRVHARRPLRSTMGNSTSQPQAQPFLSGSIQMMGDHKQPETQCRPLSANGVTSSTVVDGSSPGSGQSTSGLVTSTTSSVSPQPGASGSSSGFGSSTGSGTGPFKPQFGNPENPVTVPVRITPSPFGIPAVTGNSTVSQSAYGSSTSGTPASNGSGFGGSTSSTPASNVSGFGALAPKPQATGGFGSSTTASTSSGFGNSRPFGGVGGPFGTPQQPASKGST